MLCLIIEVTPKRVGLMAGSTIVFLRITPCDNEKHPVSVIPALCSPSPHNRLAPF